MEASTLAPATIVVRNLTSPGTFTEIELERMVWAVSYQARFQYNRSPWVERGYATAIADVRLLAEGEKIPAGAWICELLDTTDQPEALGFHEDQVFDNTLEGQPSTETTSVHPRKASARSARGITLHPQTGEEVPLMKIACRTSREDGVQPSEVFSHEVLESAVDPRVMSEGQVRTYVRPATHQRYIGEICDAVQGEGYDVGAPEGRPCGFPEATVANFVNPGWFGAGQTRPELDFRGSRRAPFELAAQGYISVQPETGGEWQQVFGDASAAPSPSVAPPAEHQQRHHHEQLVELLYTLIGKVQNMEDVLAGIAADEAELATIVPKLVERDETLSKKLGEFEAKVAAGEVVPASEIEQLRSGLDSSIASLKALLPAEEPPVPLAPTTEDVTVQIGESGEGGTTIPHAPESVTIATGPGTGTASIEAVAEQPGQAYVKVVSSTPSTTQTVTVTVAAPAAA
jgi:hypothetical protein